MIKYSIPRGWIQYDPYLPHYGAAFACSHFRYPQRHRCHLAMDFPLARGATGLPCSAEMTRSVRPALYAGSVDYPWQRNRKPLYSLQEEPRSILGSLRVTTLMGICIFWSYDQA